MKSNFSKIARQWSNHLRLRLTGDIWCVDRDHEAIQIVGEVDQLVAKIVASKGDLYSVHLSKQGHPKVAMKALGSQLLEHASRIDDSFVRAYFNKHEFSPYFELWETHQLSTTTAPDATLFDVAALNFRISKLREHARTKSFKTKVDNRKRGVRKNRDGAVAYMDALCRRHGRLLVVRVDLSYKSDKFSEVFTSVRMDSLSARRHFQDILTFLRSEAPGQPEYLWNVQFGASRGYFFQLLLIYDGKRQVADVQLGRAVTDQWNTITGGRGDAWNCNADRELYFRRGLPHIGMVDSSNKDLRRSLYEHAEYFSSFSYLARLNSLSFPRIFGRRVCEGVQQHQPERWKQRVRYLLGPPQFTAAGNPVTQ